MPQPAFVGRAAEQAALLAALDESAQGHGRIAMIAGEPGIGKTGLAQKVSEEFERRGATGR